jgi:predicted HTH transcriptional regulator
VIEENKDRYYLALRRSQATLSTDNSRLGDWILFFLHAMKKQAQALERKLHRERDLLTLPKLSRDILIAVREYGRVSVRDVQRLTGANRNTIKVHLKRLVQLRRLVQAGKGKGTWYRL